ncbi:MAG: DUF3035 domain-containing protein [Caulobacteraceae bacterium]
MNLGRVAAGGLVCGLLGPMGLWGCQSASHAFGMSRPTPDAFMVVSKAPLVLPPEYSLRPPAPGEPSPRDLEPESEARAAMLGAQTAQINDPGEKLLVEKSGGEHADPLIRYVVDDEFGSLAHKDKGFADWVMFWRKGEPPVPVKPLESAAQAPAPVDASVEAQRIAKLTGDRPVIISRRNERRLKLPGL